MARASSVVSAATSWRGGGAPEPAPLAQGLGGDAELGRPAAVGRVIDVAALAAQDLVEDGVDHGAPPVSLNLIAAPMAKMVNSPMVLALMMVCQAV